MFPLSCSGDFLVLVRVFLLCAISSSHNFLAQSTEFPVEMQSGPAEPFNRFKVKLNPSLLQLKT